MLNIHVSQDIYLQAILFAHPPVYFGAPENILSSYVTYTVILKDSNTVNYCPIFLETVICFFEKYYCSNTEYYCSNSNTVTAGDAEDSKGKQ